MLSYKNIFFLLFFTGYLGGALSSMGESASLSQTMGFPWQKATHFKENLQSQLRHGLYAIPAFFAGYFATNKAVSLVAHQLHINETLFKMLVYARFKYILPVFVGYQSWRVSKNFLDCYLDKKTDRE